MLCPLLSSYLEFNMFDDPFLPPKHLSCSCFTAGIRGQEADAEKSTKFCNHGAGRDLAVVPQPVAVPQAGFGGMCIPLVELAAAGD